jgi:uncharacterized Ntn-hydrolase superfamily protein
LGEARTTKRLKENLMNATSSTHASNFGSFATWTGYLTYDRAECDRALKALRAGQAAPALRGKKAAAWRVAAAELAVAGWRAAN